MGALSNEELVDRYAECVQGYGVGYDASLAFRTELLHRLSAGNPQAEKVQISAENAMREAVVVSGMLKTEPERSDGRIQTTDELIEAAVRMPGFEALKERYRAEAHDLIHRPPNGNPCTVDCPWKAEAQRSAGRIEAGSAQPDSELSSVADDAEEWDRSHHGK